MLRQGFNPSRSALLCATVFSLLLGSLALPLLSASCGAHTTAGSAQALETLRTMTRGGVLPAEDAVARLEAANPNTSVAVLARIVRARIRMKAGDNAGAARLLETATGREQTAISDYILFLRAQALEGAGRRVEARAAYEQVAREYPQSLIARAAILKNAELAMQDGAAGAVPLLVKKLSDADDPAALLLAAQAFERQNDSVRALAAYRRIYFYAPAAEQSKEAAAAILRLGSSTAPGTAEEARARADRLFAAKAYIEAANAYTDGLARFPDMASAEIQLRRGIALSHARRTAEAIMALTSIPSSAGETRAEALYYFVQTHANARQWDQARARSEELRRLFPQSPWAVRALVVAGQKAKEAKDMATAADFFRAAVNAYPNTAEVAGAQFELAWLAHEAKNYPESSRLLIEHLAFYADKNTDNRGRAGYWAARDSERAGRISEARALYEAMQARYDANWYGYLAKQRLDAMNRAGQRPAPSFAPDSPVARACANLKTVTVGDESAGPAERAQVARADQLVTVGLDDWAIDELNQAAERAPSSPLVNLALARIYRARDDNVTALNILRRSYPDYSQMKPEEMSREEWDVFYPLAHWEAITQAARARGLDPYQVAGLIRQESVFNPRARSGANAHGLMQVLVPTGRLIAKKYGVEREVDTESIYEPRLNIQLGTAYMREQLDKYGRIEYMAAAYNAGPNRVVQWRASLPAEIDEWTEEIPFKETRGYVQGVVRNTLQYRRLYDEQGRFRPEVGARPVRPAAQNEPQATPAPDSSVRPRRVSNEE
jgi:soluble lytic murein transglycosylase